MVTTYAIAKEAGVSQSTVSRVLNRNGAVSEKKVIAVREAMARLGTSPILRPNRLAQSRKGYMIAWLSCGNGEELTQIPRSFAFISLMEGIEHASQQFGADLLLGNGNHPKSFPRALSEKRVDGVILVGRSGVVPAQETLSCLQNIPMVWIRSRQLHFAFNGDQVDSDHETTGYQAAMYLVNRGCKSLAYINPQGLHPAYYARGCSFYGAGKKHGIPVQMLVDYDSDERKTAEELSGTIEQLLKEMLLKAPYPDGLFSPCDTITRIVYRVLNEQGVAPGKDITVVSCNNENAIIDTLDPVPASFDLNHQQIGYSAVEALIRRIENPALPFQRIQIQPSLKEYNSQA